MKGIRSPWAPREVPAPSIFDGAKPGTQPVRISGGAYAIVVMLQVRPKPELVETLGMAVLGEALQALRDATPTFDQELKTQNLHPVDRPPTPSVALAFGNLTIWAAAGSTNLQTATAMAVDRVALALTRLFQREPDKKKILEDHYVQITRMT
jgi:hypothetical protein